MSQQNGRRTIDGNGIECGGMRDFSFCLANAKTVVYDSLPLGAHANRNDAKGNRDNLKSSNKTIERRRQQQQQRRWRRPVQARLSYLYGNFLPFSSSSSSFFSIIIIRRTFFPFSSFIFEWESECIVDIFISFYFREAEKKKSTLKFMGNFAHKFNTRDIKPKLASRAKRNNMQREWTEMEWEKERVRGKKLFIQTLFDSWVHLVAYNSLEMLYIQPEEQLSAFYYEESLLFPLLLITKFSAVYVYSCEHLLAACRSAYANSTDTLTQTHTHTLERLLLQ